MSDLLEIFEECEKNWGANFRLDTEEIIDKIVFALYMDDEEIQWIAVPGVLIAARIEYYAMWTEHDGYTYVRPAAQEIPRLLLAVRGLSGSFTLDKETIFAEISESAIAIYEVLPTRDTMNEINFSGISDILAPETVDELLNFISEHFSMDSDGNFHKNYRAILRSLFTIPSWQMYFFNAGELPFLMMDSVKLLASVESHEKDTPITMDELVGKRYVCKPNENFWEFVFNSSFADSDKSEPIGSSIIKSDEFSEIAQLIQEEEFMCGDALVHLPASDDDDDVHLFIFVSPHRMEEVAINVAKILADSDTIFDKLDKFTISAQEILSFIDITIHVCNLEEGNPLKFSDPFMRAFYYDQNLYIPASTYAAITMGINYPRQATGIFAIKSSIGIETEETAVDSHGRILNLCRGCSGYYKLGATTYFTFEATSLWNNGYNIEKIDSHGKTRTLSSGRDGPFSLSGVTFGIHEGYEY